ncbi:MAG: acylphosphatase [Methylococcales bacterium]|nr:acylphosphatase [Methylococcales bacterium]
MRRVKIVVSGRVQGVYFRYFTQKEAEKSGVRGSVKNLDDGRVEIIAEADSATLDAFIRWCHKGAITARVDSVEISELERNEPLTGFTRN